VSTSAPAGTTALEDLEAQREEAAHVALNPVATLVVIGVALLTLGLSVWAAVGGKGNKPH